MSEFEPNNQAASQEENSRIGVDWSEVWPALSDARNDVSYLRRFEETLRRDGLLAHLEQVGILPVVHNPNPFDPLQQTNEYERWWWQGVDEDGELEDRLDDFRKRTYQRLDRLSDLLVGSLIGYVSSQASAQSLSEGLAQLLGPAEDSAHLDARAFVVAYSRRKWNKRKERKEYHSTLREINRLDLLYPELRAEAAWQEKRQRQGQ